jgi:L,D-peptidoglycan transpeptidase YkuD (ErfK/YbiS/YcfS/YnhG family)
MFKIIQVIVLLSTIIKADEQIIMVVSDKFNSKTAKLFTFEKNGGHYHQVFSAIDVNLGRNGLAWGEGSVKVEHKKDEPLKREGDGCAPAGIFKLGDAFGYAPNSSTKLHYIHADKELICVDDVESSYYNQLLHVSNKKSIKSYEDMRRKDNLYEFGVIVKHNEKNIPSHGSCIFLHVQKSKNSPTSGCTSMKREKLIKLIEWLDYKKRPVLIQIPKPYYKNILKIYPELFIK